MEINFYWFNEKIINKNQNYESDFISLRIWSSIIQQFYLDIKINYYFIIYFLNYGIKN